MVEMILICVFASVFFCCLYIILMQNFAESREKTKKRVLGLIDVEEEEKKNSKKLFGLKRKKKKKVSVFANTRKEFVLLEDELYNLGIKIPVQTCITLWIAITIGIPMLLLMAGVKVLICLVCFGVALIAPFIIIKRKKKKRKEELEKQLIEGITTMCNVLRAGHSFQSAMNNIATEMEGPLSEEFGRVCRETQRGMTLDASMNAMSERVGSRDLDMLCQTILIQRKVGGNLAEVLEKIAGTIQGRLDLKEEVKTLTSSGKLSGYIIGALPFFLLFIINLMNSEYMSIMFTTKIGNIMLAVSIGLEILGFTIINKIVDIKY